MSRVKALARKKLYNFAEKKGMPKMEMDAENNYAMGGMAGESEDQRYGEYSPHDSSGEPHTDEYLEDEQPMEYMAMGGIPGVGENFEGPMSESQMDPDMDADLFAGMEEEDSIHGESGMSDNDLPYDEGFPEHDQPMPHLAKGGKLGSGKRFEHLTHELAGKGANDPKALAAYIGRKSLGKDRFQNLAAKGRERASKMSSGGMAHHAFAHALKRHGMK